MPRIDLAKRGNTGVTEDRESSMSGPFLNCPYCSVQLVALSRELSYGCRDHGEFELLPDGRVIQLPLVDPVVDPASPVAGVWRKLARANEHFNHIVVEIGNFSRENPVQFEIEPHPEMQHIAFTIDQPTSPDPMLGLVIGDFVHNVRSALDHLLFRVAVHFNDPSDPFVEDRIQFPICDEPETFANLFGRTPKNKKRPLYGLPAVVHATLEQVQPYHPPSRPELRWLAELSNFDKHRTIHTIGEIATRTKIQMWTGNVPRVLVTQQSFRHGDSIRFGLGTYPLDQLRIATDVTMNVAFTDPPLAGLLIVPTLRSIFAYVEQDVVPLFERFFDAVDRGTI